MIRHNGIEIDRVRKTIAVGGRRVQFALNTTSFYCFRGFEHLLLVGPNGASRLELFDRMYSHRADGGPDSVRIVDVLMSRNFKQIAHKLGLKVTKHRHNSRIRYGLRVV